MSVSFVCFSVSLFMPLLSAPNKLPITKLRTTQHIHYININNFHCIIEVYCVIIYIYAAALPVCPLIQYKTKEFLYFVVSIFFFLTSFFLSVFYSFALKKKWKLWTLSYYIFFVYVFFYYFAVHFSYRYIFFLFLLHYFTYFLCQRPISQ